MTTLARVLDAGNGLTTRKELRGAGMSYWRIARRVGSGELRAIHPHVLGDGRLELDEGTRLRAALLQAGPDAAISHTSALYVWGLDRRVPDEIHVTVPGGGRREVSGLVQHRGKPERHEAVGFRVVSVRDALIGSASLMDVEELRFPAMQAAQQGLVEVAELEDPARVPKQVAAAMRLLAEEVRAGAESGGEANFWRLVQGSGLPMPTLQHEVRTHLGTKRVDAYWEEFKLGVEIDGREFHGQLAAFDLDRIRRNAIQATGIVIINFSVAEVMRNPRQVLEVLEANLNARAAELGVRLAA